MRLLNILLHYDGTTAWENILILLAALVAGFLLHQYLVKTKANQQFHQSLKEWENKHRQLENEFKAYKSTINSSEKTSQKSVTELSGRVKALEGDIRALSDEKNKYQHQLQAKEDELKKYSSQVVDLEDRLKTLREEKLKTEAEWNQKLKATREELDKAAAWESKVKSAEEEAQRSRAAIGHAERKKLEAELRLKATADYAGKVVPLEQELSAFKEKYSALEAEASDRSSLLDELRDKLNLATTKMEKDQGEILQLKDDLLSKDTMIKDLDQKLQFSGETLSNFRIASAELELLKTNKEVMQHELDAGRSAQMALASELEQLKERFRNMAMEYEMLKSPKPAAIPENGSTASALPENRTSLEGIGSDGAML